MKYIFLTLVFLFWHSPITAQEEIDSLTNIYTRENLTPEEKRQISRRLTQLKRERLRNNWNRQSEIIQGFESDLVQLSSGFDSLELIAKDETSSVSLREKSLELLINSNTSRAYAFLVENMTDIYIFPEITPGEEQIFYYHYCFYLLRRMDEGKEWRLLPYLMNALNTRERRNTYSLMVASLLQNMDREMLDDIFENFEMQYDSKIFSNNIKMVRHHLN